MVLTHTTNHSYTHPFPTVTLAFFLRYYSPQLNPFSAHVLSTDTIESHVDPETGRLYTTRIHLKKSRMPSAIIKLLPTSVTGGAGEKSSYVLENSIVDIKEGWMKTESRNLNFTGVLSVTEAQHYSATPPEQADNSALSPAVPRFMSPNTWVSTTFSYRSTLGSRKADKAVASEDNSRGRFGWISGWGAKRIQSSIESIASNKTDDQIIKSRDGMKMVLERLRSNGVVAVLRELNRREGKSVFEA
ncbi:UPS1 mitochondrial intermembrane space [Apiospora phragmitis]|uniref:UPS1 mitochondrial intermembrane space n=1 Tax=Apiospora phragmitis TaxID=2905665 RepID=A0ABR1VPZ7_9PEZI